ncbi:MAG TPA: hypothetical protein VF575_05525 [Candidatus Saccharimonadales bacterium]|jgi:hypothetical protein
MSEAFPTSDEQYPKILPLFEDVDPDAVQFLIDKTTRGKDVLTTLHYLQPDDTAYERQVDNMLLWGTTTGLIPSKCTVELPDPTNRKPDGTPVIKSIELGDEPSYTGTRDALTQTFGEDNVTQSTELLVERLIDDGHYNNSYVRCTQHNEFATQEADAIASELEALRRQLGEDL